MGLGVETGTGMASASMASCVDCDDDDRGSSGNSVDDRGSSMVCQNPVPVPVLSGGGGGGGMATDKKR